MVACAPNVFGGWRTPLLNMNKIYSLVWNAAQSRWVIASELSSKQKKGGMRKTMLKGLAALLLTSAASSAFAGTCIQQDELAIGSAMGTGSGKAATCDVFSIAIGAGSGAGAGAYSVAMGMGHMPWAKMPWHLAVSPLRVQMTPRQQVRILVQLKRAHLPSVIQARQRGLRVPQ
ncbi:hypothetical protein GXP68_02625 [Ewingella americana]|nr:hypothetical protein GXP68_02625 [Ewingella americana]